MLPYYPMFWSDYLAKTRYLSQGEHGAYVLLLAWIYTEGKPVPHDRRFEISSAKLKNEKAFTEKVLNQYFVKTDAGWIDKRAIEVIDEYNEKHRKRVIAGSKGGQQKASNARVMLEQCSSNQNQNQNQTPSYEGDSPLPPNESETTDAKRSKPRRKPTTFIPEDFSPDIGGIAICTDHGFDVGKTTAEFIAYWQGRGESRADWQAVYRNRIRQLAQYRTEREQRAEAQRGNVRDVTGTALRVAARHDAKDQTGLR